MQRLHHQFCAAHNEVAVYRPAERSTPLSMRASCFTPRVKARPVSDDEPSSYTEAMSRPDAAQWRAAIDSELDSLRRTGTWTLTPLAAGRQAIGSRWVLKIKRKADGTIDKYKARLVAKGYAQKAGIDYDETFAPVAKFTSIRMLLALAAHHDLEIHQMDVKTAFLNGDLDVDIYHGAAGGIQHAGCTRRTATGV